MTLIAGTIRKTLSGVKYASPSAGSGLLLRGSTSGSVGLIAPATVTTPYKLTLPAALGASDKLLQVDSSGNITFVDAPAGGTPAGSGTEIQYRNAGAFGAVAETSYSGNTLLFTSGAAATIPLAIKAHASQSGNLFEARLSTDAVRARIKETGAFSNDVGQTNSEGFGYAANPAGDHACCFGYASASARYGIAIGSNTNCGGSFSCAVGALATTTSSSNTYCAAIGCAATISGSSISYSVALGSYATVTASNQFVCGCTYGAISDVYFGKGVSDAAATAWTLHGTGGSGTNNAGGNLVIAPGQSTGNVTPASVVMQATVAGASGTTPQTLVSVAQITGTGIEPATDDTYYLGRNDDDTPKAWKAVILKDTTNGKYYRLEIVSGVVTATDLTD